MMTVNQLHKLTGELIAQGHKRKTVCIDKDTFYSPLEGDGATILDVWRGDMNCFPMLDDDGYIKTRADGSESVHWALVMKGQA